LFCFLHGLGDLCGSRREDRMCAHCLRVLFEVDGHVFARQPACLLIAETQLISKIRHAANSLKTQDALVSVVINHHDGEFESLGHGGPPGPSR